MQDDRISLHSLLKKKDELIYKSRVPEQLRKDDSSQNGTRTRSKAVRADNSRGGKMDRQLLYMNKPLQILLGRKSRFNTDVLRTFTIAVLSFINVVKRIVIYVIKKKKGNCQFQQSTMISSAFLIVLHKEIIEDWLGVLGG